MLLIQSNTWDGPTATAELIHDTGARTLEAWASRRDANEALQLLKQYEELFRRMYRSRAVNFYVVGIQEIPELCPAALEAGNIRIIEDAIHQLQAEFRERANL